MSKFRFGFLLVILCLFMSTTVTSDVKIARLDDTQAGPDVARMTVLEGAPGVIPLKVTVGGFYHDTVTTKGGDFTLLAFRDHGFTTAIGAPKLPAIHEFIEIPAGCEADVIMTGGVYKEYFLKDFGILKQIVPVQEPLEKTPGAWEEASFWMDDAIYETSAFYPNASVVSNGTGFMRNHKVLSITAHPVTYNPVTRSVRCYTEMYLDVVVHPTGPAVMDERLVSPLFEKNLEKVVLNYEPPIPGDKVLGHPVGYLVICPDALVSNITPFTDWRTKKGFKVTIATQTDIPSWTTSGISSYIDTAYNTWDIPPTGVLLVGDTNYIPAFNGSSCSNVTDIYFVTVTTPDIFPDIYIARMPARNTTDVDNMVDKFLDYEQNNMGTGWYDQACFLAPPDAGAQGEITHNAVIADYFEPAGLTCYKIYSSQGGGTTDIINNLNAGRTVCQYSGHGYSDGWAEPAFSSSYIDSSLTNAGMYPFVGSYACSTNPFGDTEVYGEVWVKRPNKGAIAFWGASCSTYWDEDDILERRLWEAYFAENLWSFAEMCDDAKIGVWDYYSGGGLSQYYMETYNIIGDPLMNMWSATPFTATVSYPGVIPVGPSDVTVTVHNGATPVKDALVCIMQGTTFHSTAYTDGSGTAIVSVHPLVPDPCDITVTALNMDPYESTIIPSASGPYVMYQSCVIDDDNSGLSSGNGDGNANPGESLELGITVKNFGSDPAYGVTATLTSADANVLITDGTAGFGDIPAGATAVNADALTVDILSTCPDGYAIPFTLSITDGSEVWDSNFSIAVIGAELVYYGYTVTDTPVGNNDGDADPGETITLEVVLENTGAVNATAISAVLTSDQPTWVGLIDDTADFGDIGIGLTGSSLYPHFAFTLDYDTPCGLLINFTLNIATAEGSVVTTFPFIVGGMGVGFTDDMESGEGSWTHYAGQGTDDWAIITSGYAHSPTHCWRSTDVSSLKDDYLITPTFSVTFTSELTFWHRYDLEDGFDGGVIEITTNGTTWVDLGSYITQGGYNDTISTSFSSPIGGRDAWSGTLSAMSEVIVDLSTFAGATDAQIRYRLACDTSVSADGWYVDDVEIIGAECQPYSGPPNVDLANGAVSPDSGYYGTRFTFSVDYYNLEGHAPSLIQVNIDGTGYDMTLDSGTADNGTYIYRTRDIAQDVAHTYFFYAEDGYGSNDLDPQAGAYDGPATMDPLMVLTGDAAPGVWMTVEVWGVADALWGAAWSSQNGPFYLPASGLTYDVGPGNIHLVKKVAADPLHLDDFGYAFKDFKLPDTMGTGTKYMQATTKLNAYWAKTNFDTFIITN